MIQVVKLLAQTSSIQDAAVRATVGDGVEGKELGTETVKLFNCSKIGRMIQESMSWWSLLRRFVPQNSRKEPYTFTSGIVTQPYSPQLLHEHEGVKDGAVQQVKRVKEH